MESTPGPQSLTGKAAGTIQALGIGLILLGVLSALAPRQSGMTVGVLVGIFLLVSGFLRIAFAWIAASWGSAFLRFGLGVLAVVAGSVMVFNPARGLEIITIVVIVYFIADGVSEILFALRLPPAAGGTWVMLSGILSLVLGILIWRQWPVSGDHAVGVLVGIKLIMDGVVLIAVAAGARAVGRAISRQ